MNFRLLIQCGIQYQNQLNLIYIYLFSGIKFVPNVHVGHDISAEHLYENNDAVLLCMGATRPRDLPIANRESTGIFKLCLVHHMTTTNPEF